MMKRQAMIRRAAVIALAMATVGGGLAISPAARADDDWGIDISRWQGNINVAGADDFVIVKQSGSDTGGFYVDPYYAANTAKVRASGKLLGHYYYNGWADPTYAANRFVDNLVNYRAGDPLVYDAEESRFVSPAKVQAWVNQVRARLGSAANVYVYMSSSVTSAYNWAGVAGSGVKLWVANYGTNNGGYNYSPSVSYWAAWSIHQYTSTGRISTYAGNLDGNRARAGAWGAGQTSGTSTGSGSGAVAASAGTNVWGYSIEQIQRLLNARINAGLVVDGIQGSATTAAVRTYQASRGLAVDGIVGPQTWASLNGATQTALAVDGWVGHSSVTRLQQVLGTTADGIISSQSSWAAGHALHVTSMTRGQAGSRAVVALQHRLGVTADGQLGPATIAAWQHRLGVTADGQLGAVTARAIQQALNNGRLW
jgi:peptidoglycan hydrolase-like protein with peptidoglycan-binding domain